MRWARRFSAVLCVASLLVVSVAGAHDNWLEVEPFSASAPGRAKIYLLSGEHFTEAEPLRVRGRERYVGFQLIAARGRRDLLPELREDQEPLAHIGLGKAAGSFVIALEAAPRSIEINAKHFEEYLLEERLVDILLLRAIKGGEDTPGRERYSRSLKAILQVGPSPDPLVTQPIGATLEIVPLAHPQGLAPGASLTVQVLFKGKPLAGRAVMAANRFRKDVSTKTLRMDVDGKVSFPIARAGDWMFRLVHMEISAEADVDWRSYWSSLTFSLPEPRATPLAAAR